ncbi:hypothetical protein KY289_001162 [Solanum tuberosum]|nr:hypothetical protein KY289_001162 [Solanum tuberosum]
MEKGRGAGRLSTELRRLWMSKGRVIDGFLGYQKKKILQILSRTSEVLMTSHGTIFIFLISKRSALFGLLESFLTTKSPEGLRSSQLACRKVVDIQESNPCIIHCARIFGVLIRYMQWQ